MNFVVSGRHLRFISFDSGITFGSFLDHFWMIFGSFLEARHHHNPLIFGSFLHHFGSFLEAPHHQNPSIFGSFFDHFGSFLEAPHHQNSLILGSFLDHFWMIFGSFLEARHHHNPLIFRPFLDHFGSFLEAPHNQNPSIFGSFFDHFGSFLEARRHDTPSIWRGRFRDSGSGPAPLRQRPGSIAPAARPNAPVLSELAGVVRTNWCGDPTPTYIRCIPLGRRAVPFVLGGGWGSPPTIIVSVTTREGHPHTRKNERKSHLAVRLEFCKKRIPYSPSVFGAPKGVLRDGF